MSQQSTVDLDGLSDLRTPWCIRVVVTLRIAEHIAAGITDVDGLAAAAACDSDSLSGVLRHLVSRGIFEETAPGRFGLNEAARPLLDPAERIGLDLNGVGGRMAHVWSTLLAYVRGGTTAYHELYGLTFWDDLDAHPEIAASFDALMGPAGHGTPDPDVLGSGGWDSIRTVVDVGGGTGALLAAILRAHPDVHGTLVDLPRTVARSSEIFSAAGVAERATAVGQSFFDPLPSGADLYLLKSVLNDWPDAEATAILRRCAEAARSAGRVVVIGVSHDDERTGISVEMVLAGGKQRTLARFTELARAAGLGVQGVARKPSGRLIVECRPT